MYEAHSNLYFARYIENGQTHRTLIDDFDWALLLNRGVEVRNVEKTDLELEILKPPRLRKEAE